MPARYPLRTLLPAAFVAASLASPPAIAQVPTVEHVIHISVDGLHVGAVPALLAAPGDLAPNFRRLREEGVFTDNARTDPVVANTMPNHASQMTGRAVLGAGGHGWFINDDPDVVPPLTVHALKGSYVASVFDVAHDHGLSTALYANKSKFAVFDRSWDEVNGAPDLIGNDDGHDKIDTYVYSGDMDALVSAYLADMASNPYHYSLLHLRAPDSAGHGSTWDLSTAELSDYMSAVVWVDQKLGEVLALVDGSPALRDRTAIILTSDHGGELGTTLHLIARSQGLVDSGMVPFYVWGPGVGPAGVDLYLLNALRRDPGMRLPFWVWIFGPVRNADAANLALDFLGLPPVPGSVINAFQELRVGP